MEAQARKNNVRPCMPKNGQPVTVGTKVANMKKHLPVQHCRPSVGRRPPGPHTNQKNNAGDRKTADAVANRLYSPALCLGTSSCSAFRVLSKRGCKAHGARCPDEKIDCRIVVTVRRSAILGFGFMWQAAYW